MSSINLLPKSSDFNDREKQNSKNKLAILTSLTITAIILTPIIFYAILYFKNINSSEKIDSLNAEIEILDEEIREKIENNKLLTVENKAADANNLLAQHPYFTKVINLINKNLIANLYLTSLIIDFDKQEFLTIKIKAVAKNSSTIASQTLVFKNMPNVDSVKVSDIIPTKEGYVDFNMELDVKKQIIFYEETTNDKKIN